MGSHKGHAPLDSTPRGKQRWLRAAVNAVENPHSKAAKLYRYRVEIAHALVKECEKAGTSTRAPLQFMSREWVYLAGRYVVGDFKRKYAVCGVYCFAMQGQLETQQGRLGLDMLLSGTSEYRRVEAMTPEKMVRDMHCFACGTLIKRK